MLGVFQYFECLLEALVEHGGGVNVGVGRPAQLG